MLFSVALAGVLYDNLFLNDHVCRTAAGRAGPLLSRLRAHPTSPRTRGWCVFSSCVSVLTCVRACCLRLCAVAAPNPSLGFSGVCCAFCVCCLRTCSVVSSSSCCCLPLSSLAISFGIGPSPLVFPTASAVC